MHQWKKNKHLMLFSDCQVVNGSLRSIIVDLNRSTFDFIPNSLAELLTTFHGKTKEDIVLYYGRDNISLIEEYLVFLGKKEYVFWCDSDEVTLFPPIDLTWDWPANISNAIFDIGEYSYLNFENIVEQLEQLSCQNIQIRSYSYKSIDFWIDLLGKTTTARIKSIEIITMWHKSIDLEEVKVLIRSNQRLRSIIFHSAPKYEIINNNSNMGAIVAIQDKIDSSSHCGIIHWNYFNINIKLYTEAQKHNTCLNRKISIDVNGEIKNCPSMAKSYGNIKDTTLQEAIEKPGFKDLWYINKDQVSVCKDCEFRYICTDCRAYIEKPEDIYSKPLKCGYNPYTAEWEEWSANPLKQKAIEYYGMQELVKK